MGQPLSALTKILDLGKRTFCSNCGTHLLFEFTEAPDEIDVTISSLDDPNKVAPDVHLWLSSSPKWYHIQDDLPKFQENRIRH